MRRFLSSAATAAAALMLLSGCGTVGDLFGTDEPIDPEGLPAVSYAQPEDLAEEVQNRSVYAVSRFLGIIEGSVEDVQTACFDLTDAAAAQFTAQIGETECQAAATAYGEAGEANGIFTVKGEGEPTVQALDADSAVVVVPAAGGRWNISSVSLD